MIHPAAAIGHICLDVTDLSRSVDFYRDMIGLKVLQQNQRQAQLGVNGKDPLLILHAGAKSARPAATRGLYHFALLVPDRKTLATVVQHLSAQHIRMGQADHLVSEALYVNDPDQNGIEIYADRPRSSWLQDANQHYAMDTKPIDMPDLLAQANGIAWAGLPEGTIIGHVHLHTSHLTKASDFFCRLLGFEVTALYGDQALFVAAGGYHHHIGLNTWAGEGAPPPPPDAAGLRYFTIQLPNVTALHDVLQRLQSDQVDVQQSEEAWIVFDPSTDTQIHLQSI